MVQNVIYVLQGDLQLLRIAPTPDEAYELCNKYAGDCVSDNSEPSSTIKTNIDRTEENSIKNYIASTTKNTLSYDYFTEEGDEEQTEESTEGCLSEKAG